MASFVQPFYRGFLTLSHTLTRLDGFAIGGLIASLLHGRVLNLSRCIRYGILTLAAGLFLWIGSQPLGGYFGSYTNWTYSLAAVASGLCVLALVSVPVRSTSGKWMSFVCHLGKISYGLYVFHLTAIWAAELIVPENALPEASMWIVRTALAAFITLIFADISYRYFEKPFLRMKRKFTYVESRPE